jgi:hypothetical protein
MGALRWFYLVVLAVGGFTALVAMLVGQGYPVWASAISAAVVSVVALALLVWTAIQVPDDH